MDWEQKLDFTSGGHAEPGVWAPRLNRLLHDQLALAGRLEAMGQERSSVLTSGDYQRYLACLAERTPLIREMVLLNEELQPFIERFGTLATSLRTDERDGIHQQAARLDAKLASIHRNDEAEAEILHAKRDAIARDLAAVSTGRGALAAYDPMGGSVTPQVHDREG
jgi:hypothetical protein